MPLHRETIASSEKRHAVDEATAKARLNLHGIAVPQGCRIDDLSSAAKAAERIGFPLALKVLGLAHKSDSGGLRLNLNNQAALSQSVEDLRGLGQGLYLEAMIGDAVCEIIVGLTRDPQFGFVLTLGIGGVLVEILDDTRCLLMPSSRTEVEAALDSLRAAPLLKGYRGRAAADKAALLDLIMAVQDFALAKETSLLELDINPVIVCAKGEGAFAADALIVEEERPHG